MSIQDFVNGPAAVSLVFGLARIMPPRQGYWLADRLGGLLSHMRNSNQVRAVKANQSIIGQGRLTDSELQQITRETLQSKARNIYDYFHFFDDLKTIQKMVEIDDTLKLMIENHRKSQKGLMVVSAHFSNFDLELRAAVLAGMRSQVLVYSQVYFSYRFQNRIRGLEGMEVTPVSFSAMQKALQLLKNGGIVATAVDRPNGESRYQPIFFGQPSALPVGHVQMALKADVPVVVVSGRTFPDGHYCVWASDPIPMRRFNDPNEEVLWNTEQILKNIEQIILWDPKQWSMFYPVWPDKTRGK